MTTIHTSMHLFAGDDWEINATLLDETGAPFDLSGAPQVKWSLLTNYGAVVIDDVEVNVSITNAEAGQCMILVPAAQTSALTSDFYKDVIRLVMGGVTSTLAYGPIYVTADPWAVAAKAAAPVSNPNVVRMRA